jgi:hypothetical protein
MVIGKNAADLWLWEHAGNTMAGVLGRIHELVNHIGAELATVWQRRHADPPSIGAC